MPRYRPRVPIATLRGDDPKLVIDWKQLEYAYGHELDPDVRAQIWGATYTFLAISDFEDSAQPVSVARKRIGKIERAASKLQNAILEIPKRVDSDTFSFADDLISGNLHDTRINGKLQDLGSVMVSVMGACRTALEQLETGNRGPRKGTSWQRWVLKLTEIAKGHQLPIRARKDTDKAKKASPFVKLIGALQIYLPREQRRSDTALAKAIHDAFAISGRNTSRSVTHKSRNKVIT